MKQLLTEKPKVLKMMDVEPPKIEGPKDVLVKMKAAGIAGQKCISTTEPPRWPPTPG